MCIYIYTGEALSHAGASPDNGINLPVLENVFPSGPSMCFRHMCALQYLSIALRRILVFGCCFARFKRSLFVFRDGRKLF